MYLSTCSKCAHPLGQPKLQMHPFPELQLRRRGDISVKSQTLLIRTVIGDAKDEITRLKDMIQTLKERLEKVEMCVAEHEALVAPIRQLPSEVLSEIFLSCLPQPPPTSCPSEMPLVLGQVSRHWRDVWLSTPGLWANITVHCSNIDNRVISRVETCIKRSGDCPLTIDINAPSEDCTRLLEAIIPHSERWYSIAFNMRASMHRLLTRVRGRLPLLANLRLASPDFDPKLSSAASTYELAPRLTSAHIDTRFDVNLPWNQLITWSGGGTLQDYYAILKDAPILSSATLPEPTAYQAFKVPDCPVVHRSLSSLNIELNATSSDLLLPCLHLPNLDSLLYKQTSLYSGRVDIFRAFLRRSLKITRLELNVRSMANSSLLKCLGDLPSLVSFTLISKESNITDTFLQRLILRPTVDVGVGGKPQVNLVPQLETLTFVGKFSVPGDKVIVPLVLSRWSQSSRNASQEIGLPNKCLQSIRIHTAGPLGSASRQCLEEFAELGLNVSLFYHME